MAWWSVASQGSLQRFVLLVGISFGSLMVGCLVGFLLSSYGEEVGTVGKVRDWLIGGIAALTIAKAATLKTVVDAFAVGNDPAEFPLMLSQAIIYVSLGFFVMFFARELILNVPLAQRRSERSKLESSREAGQVIQRFLSQLPASMLSGVEDVSEIAKVKEEELRSLLYSADVESFLKSAEEASRNGTLDWDLVSKTAHIYYYRSYFEKENRGAAVERALEWITRALNMNPEHADMTIKYADMLDARGQHGAAVTVLERLALRSEAPAYVRQWLGYYLLNLPGREKDAIRYSEEYLKFFPDDDSTPFNIARAYAQMYCSELKSKGQVSDPESSNRSQALLQLRRAFNCAPDYAETWWTKWTKKGEVCDCLAADKDFAELVGRPATPSSSGSR